MVTIPMMMMGLKTFPVSVVRISMGMAPIVGVLLAWLYLNEETLSKIIHFLVQNPLSINFSYEHQMLTIKNQRYNLTTLKDTVTCSK